MEKYLQHGLPASQASIRYDPHPTVSELEKTKYRSVDDVRIIPAKIVFESAFDGKIFNQQFTIINCGKNIAVVRISPPSSNAIKLKAVPKGYMLSPGMRITRHVTYTYNSAMALPEASIPVYINDKPLIYQIEVKLNSPFVVLSPKAIDFGEIDVRNPSEQKYIKLRNLGRKITQFSVDLGRTGLDIIVQPPKGTINPSQTVVMSVEVMGSDPGAFDTEFWIKTEPPQRVRIMGILIEPKLILEYPVRTHRLALVDFPRTYYGAILTKTLIIKNNSSIASMFCLVLETSTGFDYLEKATAVDDELKCFNVSSKEGRLQAHQNYPLRFIFKPKYAKSFDNRLYKDFALVFLRVVKIHYRDGTVDDKKMKTYQAISDITVLDEESEESVVSDRPFYTDEVFDEDLQICLYGEMEHPSLKFTPDSFTMDYLKAYEPHIYELNIKNGSPSLPIIVVYNKIPCIELEPKRIHLGPNGSLEATVTVKPSKVGPVSTKIVFDLIYEAPNESCKVGTAAIPIHYVASMACPRMEPKFNLGITPQVVNEVGLLVDDVRYNTNVSKPTQAIVDKNFNKFKQNNSDLIAFPNDRPKGLRPWTSDIPCTTIYANLPRLVSQQGNRALNGPDNRKALIKQRYVDYFRSPAGKKPKQSQPPSSTPPHYDVDEKRILLQEIRVSDCKLPVAITEMVATTHVPLSPRKLLRIKINPKFVELGQVAPNTLTKDCFYIHNGNEFAISVDIKAVSNAILINGRKKLVISPHAEQNIFFDCVSRGLGKYHVPVFIIVNDFHIFDATVLADVVPTTVYCPHNEIVTNPTDNRAIFEVFNQVNCDLSFTWEVQDPSFEVFPATGRIPPRKSMYCRASFHPHSDEIYGNEIYLMSQNGVKQTITVYYENVKADIGFNSSLIKFENIPLNAPVSRHLVVKNFADKPISYAISSPTSFGEISVTPTKGLLGPMSYGYFQVSAQFMDVVDFRCELKFVTQYEYSYTVRVEGNVVFPNVSIIPEFIQFNKIPAGAYERRVFRIRNMSEVECNLQFRLKDYPEVFVADSERRGVQETGPLKPNESRQLFLEFKPSDPVIYSIYLPYVINGVVGPPVLNHPRSLRPGTYFKAAGDEFKTVIETPDLLPIVAIKCAAGPPWVHFSSLELSFFYGEQREQLWTVKNVSSTEHQLAIPLLDADNPFRLEPGTEDNYQVTEKYHKVFISPGDTAVLKISFEPREFGTFCLEVPVFVDKAITKCPFNYMKLSGTFSPPVINCSKKIIFFHFIRVKENISGKVNLEFIAHQESCSVEAHATDDSLSVKLVKKKPATDSASNAFMDALVTFAPSEECCVRSSIEFKCTCGSSCTLIVKAGASNCILLTYHSFIRAKAAAASIDFKSTFPYFPKSTNTSFYGQKLRSVIATFENGIFTQRLFSQNFIKIPDSLCRVPVTVKLAGKEGGFHFEREPPRVLPLVQILIFLVNQRVVKYFDDMTIKPAFEGTEGVRYMYVIYRNVIGFLKDQRIFVPQLEPEHLLPYELYVIFKEEFEDSQDQEPVLSQEDFYDFSKQCWLDLLLQIYSVLVFDRTMCSRNVKLRSRELHAAKTCVFHKEFSRYYSENRRHLGEDMHDSEARLLLWMEFHYEKQKSILWDLHAHPELKAPRKFRCFESEFGDAMAFATALVAYCPYLLDDLRKFYPSANSEEHRFHNTCVIYEIMKKVNLRENLLQPTAAPLTALTVLQMGCYLYDTLPGFFPKETVVLSAALAEKDYNDITLRNTENASIAYTPILHSNETNDFAVDSERVVVPPKKQKVLRITYFSKSVMRKRAVLILCGETEGFKPAKTMAFNLEGTPKIFEFTEKYTFEVSVFVPTFKTLNITSPFETKYESKLYLYFGDQSMALDDGNEFIPVSVQIARNVPRQIRINPECAFDDEGSGTLDMSLCFVAVGNFSYFIYFVNDTVGDFCVRVDVFSLMKKTSFVDLEVKIPPYFSLTHNCTCNRRHKPACDCKTLNYMCSKMIVVEIPYKNSELIDAVRSMIKISTEEREFKFWNKLLDYPRGLHILRNRLKNSYISFDLPYVAVLTPTVKYRVHIAKGDVSFPKIVVFNNITSSGVFKLPIHWNSSTFPKEAFLTLTASNLNEIRRYRLIFEPPQEYIDLKY